MDSDSNQSHALFMVTIADVEKAFQACESSVNDPLAEYPAVLRRAVHEGSRTLAMQLATRGVPTILALNAGEVAYRLAAIAARSVHRSMLRCRSGGPDSHAA